jgi:hypothetical protein
MLDCLIGVNDKKTEAFFKYLGHANWHSLLSEININNVDTNKKNTMKITIFIFLWILEISIFSISCFCFLAFQSFDFECTWWRLFWVYLMKVILSVPDEGYFECTWWRLFWVYLMKVILSVPDEGYFECTWWRLFW